MLRRAMMAGGGGGGGDPYWANVVSLLHFDGADGSTTFTDQTGKSWTPAGSVQIDTAQSKFGGASCLFNGTTDYLTCTHADFTLGTGDFTIEMWVRLNSTAGNQYLLDIGSNGTIISFYSGRILYYDSVTGIGGDLYTAGPTLSTGQFYHIAVSRNSGVIRAFCDGIKWGEQAGAQNKTATNANIGRYGGGGHYLDGWLDELRITKGVGRYTANFTPPTASFPDS